MRLVYISADFWDNFADFWTISAVVDCMLSSFIPVTERAGIALTYKGKKTIIPRAELPLRRMITDITQ